MKQVAWVFGGFYTHRDMFGTEQCGAGMGWKSAGQERVRFLKFLGERTKKSTTAGLYYI